MHSLETLSRSLLACRSPLPSTDLDEALAELARVRQRKPAEDRDGKVGGPLVDINLNAQDERCAMRIVLYRLRCCRTTQLRSIEIDSLNIPESGRNATQGLINVSRCCWMCPTVSPNEMPSTGKPAGQTLTSTRKIHAKMISSAREAGHIVTTRCRMML